MSSLDSAGSTAFTFPERNINMKDMIIRSRGTGPVKDNLVGQKSLGRADMRLLFPL